MADALVLSLVATLLPSVAIVSPRFDSVTGVVSVALAAVGGATAAVGAEVAVDDGNGSGMGVVIIVSSFILGLIATNNVCHPNARNEPTHSTTIQIVVDASNARVHT